MVFRDTDYLHIKRVVYGKENQPRKLKEYKVSGELNSPVGFIGDWRDYATMHGYIGLKVEEQDGKIKYEV